jgi:hypothetical protein
MATYIVDIEAIVTVRVEAESESAAEDMAIEAVSNMDGHEVVDVGWVTNATVESQRGGE